MQKVRSTNKNSNSAKAQRHFGMICRPRPNVRDISYCARTIARYKARVEREGNEQSPGVSFADRGYDPRQDDDSDLSELRSLASSIDSDYVRDLK